MNVKECSFVDVKLFKFVLTDCEVSESTAAETFPTE